MPMARRSTCPAARFIATSAAARRASIALHPFSARAQAGQAHLRILSTTDLHCHVQPYDYYADKPTDTSGWRAPPAIIEAIRAEATNTLLVDNGDYLQGNPMGDYIAYERGMQPGDVASGDRRHEHARLRGRHARQPRVQLRRRVPRPRQRRRELPDRLRQLREARSGRRRATTRCTSSPTCCSTARSSTAPARRGRSGSGSSASCRRRSCSGTAGTSRAGSRCATSSRRRAPGCRRCARPGADVVVALSHSGIDAGAGRGDGARTPRSSSPASRGSTRSSPGTSTGSGRREDFAGDGLDLATGAISGKPAAMAGFWGSHMGLIDLLLEQRRRRLAGRRLRDERAADLQAQRGPQRHRAGRRLRAADRGDRRGPRGDARLRARRGRRSRRRRCSPTSRWSPTTPRCRSSARRRPGT